PGDVSYPFAEASGGRLLVTLPAAPPTPQTWQTLSARLADAGITRLNEVVRVLVLQPPGQSLFGDWTLEQRHGAAAALEESFLDPGGVLKAQGPVPSFTAIAEPGALEAYQARLGAALKDGKVQDAFQEYRARVASFRQFEDVDWAVDTAALAQG